MAILAIDQHSEFQRLIEQAQACQDAGLLDRAIINWQQVIEQEAEHVVAGPALGQCLLGAGQPDEAIKILQRFTGLPDASPQTWYNLGCAYALTGRSDEAFSALNHAIDGFLGTPQQFLDDEDLNALRDDPRFESLLQRLSDQPQQSSKLETSVDGGD
jgi:predicted Zn-dependent protease